MEISIEDIMNIEIDIENLPPIAVQKAVVEEIERLIAEGKSDFETLHQVFEYNKMGSKAH
ncbi:MAG: hypothetical protein ACI9LM_005206 [Alteromonadaceae bacterium]|jgi:hypothetical protein